MMGGSDDSSSAHANRVNSALKRNPPQVATATPFSVVASLALSEKGQK